MIIQDNIKWKLRKELQASFEKIKNKPTNCILLRHITFNN